MRWFFLLFALLVGPAAAQDKPVAPSDKTPSLVEGRLKQPATTSSVGTNKMQAQPSSQVRSVVLGYQQLGLSLEIMTSYYEARIADLEKRCGDPCKDN